MKWHQRILITLDIIKVDKGDEMTPRILITLDIIKVDKGDEMEMTPKD